MSADGKLDLQLEIGHVLIVDIVGYSKLSINEQGELVQELNKIIRSTPQFREAEAANKLVRLPTGDGVILVFYNSVEAPVRCALEISRGVKNNPHMQLRMGIHSGPVSAVMDVNDRANITGAGINMAQRIMNCGEAGHILVSKRVAEDLGQYRHWQPLLHDLGEWTVKHGVKVHVANLYTEEVGNAVAPEKFQPERQRKAGKFFERTPSRMLLYGTAILVTTLAAVALWYFVSHKPTRDALWTRSSGVLPATVISEKSIAVLPFQNLSEDKQNAFFTDGIQDEIITDLAKVADLKVISRTSSMQYKTGTTRNLREIGKGLGVAHIVEGSVQRISGRVRVTAQLIDARTDTHIWAEKYDRQLADVFAMQSELAEQIVAQLKARLSPAEKAAIEEQPTTDLVAYDLYRRAKALGNAISFSARRTEALFEELRLLDRAIARDPDFFLAYCESARAHDLIYLFGLDHTPSRLKLADQALNTALGLRPNSGEAHLGLAHHLYCGFLDYDRARSELAIARNALPNEPLIYELLGYIDRRQGRWEESIHSMGRALELDPRNVNLLQQISLSYENLRRFPEMAAILDRALELAPRDIGSRVARAFVELEWRADPKPLHSTISAIVAEEPSSAGDVAEAWLYLASCERDPSQAAQALAAMTHGGCGTEGIAFPRAWCEAIVARLRNDTAANQAALKTARDEVEKTIREQPNYGEAFCALGLIDAGLGRKEEALREGRRAVELLPLSKDAINGTLAMEYLATIYAWVGEKELALDQLARVRKMPGWLSYGQLRLNPDWDTLRNDPRFEEIVASLAPDPEKP